MERHTIQLASIDSENPLIDVAMQVREHLARHGIDVRDWDRDLAVPEYSDLPGDTHVVPGFMTDGSGTCNVIFDGRAGLDFTLRESQDGEANSEGNSLFTAVAVREDYGVGEIVDEIVETGQFGAACTALEDVVRDDVDPQDVAAWALATYLKGVIAERALIALDRFSKAGVSNDQAGDDVYDLERDGELRQVRSVTQSCDHDSALWYQFDMRGGIVFGDVREEVAAEAGEVSGRVGDTRRSDRDVPTTLTYRTHTHYTTPERPHVDGASATYRFINW